MTAGVAPAIQVRSYKVGTYRLLHCDHQSSDLTLFYHFISREVNMIEVKGLEKLQTKLRNIQKLEHRTAPLMEQLGEILKNSIEDSFENEKSPFGERWKPLAKSTLQNKLKKGKSERILRREGDLADNWVLKSDDDKAVISNNANNKGFAYGLAHQFGANGAGRGKRTKIPARAFLPVDKNGKLAKDVKREIKAEVISFIKSI